MLCQPGRGGGEIRGENSQTVIRRQLWAEREQTQADHSLQTIKHWRIWKVTRCENIESLPAIGVLFLLTLYGNTMGKAQQFFWKSMKPILIMTDNYETCQCVGQKKKIEFLSLSDFPCLAILLGKKMAGMVDQTQNQNFKLFSCVHF